MPLTIDTFISRANSVDPDQAIYLNDQEVKDTGKLGTFFTRKSTFHETTEAFLNALTQEYGAHVGDMAYDLLRNNMDAGKPLTAGLIREFVSLGRRHQMQDTLNRLATDRASMGWLVEQLTGKPAVQLTEQMFQMLTTCVRRCQATLVKEASEEGQNTLEALARGMKEQGRYSRMRRVIDLVTGYQGSPLVRIGYPHEAEPQMLMDKLTVLSKLQGIDAPEVPESVLIQAMSALPAIRASKPAPREFTVADLFNTVYPPASTPTLDRPDNDELGMYTPRQVAKLFEAADKDFLKNFSLDSLPADSPLRGNRRNTEGALSAAKGYLMMPGVMANLVGKRVTLENLPQIQADMAVAVAFPTLSAAVDRLAEDLVTRGRQDMTEGSPQPAIVFRSPSAGDSAVAVGPGRFGGLTSEELTPELQEDKSQYEAGKYSRAVDEILLRANGMCESGEQTKAVISCLSNVGSMPLCHVMTCFGDSAGFSLNSTISHEVVKGQDGSVEVILTTPPELKGCQGVATMAYRVDTDGRVGIVDFHWDKPTLEERKDALLHGTGHGQSVRSLIDKALGESKGNPLIRGFCTRKVMEILEPLIQGATVPEELPAMEELRDMFFSNEAHPELKKLLTVIKNPLGALCCVNLPTDRQAAFMSALAALNCSGNVVSVNYLYAHLEQLHRLYEADAMDREHIWQELFQEPLPALNPMNRLGVPRDWGVAIQNRLEDRLKDAAVDDFMRTHAGADRKRVSQLTDMEVAAKNGMMGMFSGMSLESATRVACKEAINRLTGQDVSLIGNYVFARGEMDIEAERTRFGKDLCRIGTVDVSDKRKILPSALRDPECRLDLPGGNGEVREPMRVNVRTPEGMTGDQLTAYREGWDLSLSESLSQRILDYCGTGHELQAVTVLAAAGQAGRLFLRTLSPVLDIQANEHATENVIITGDDEHNVHVRHESVPDSPMHFHWEYVIGPDGSQHLMDFLMERAPVERQ